MSVYFMQPTDGGPVKIGTSKNVEQRRKQLEYEYNRDFVILKTIKGGRNKEHDIHDRFAHLALGNEQFRPCPDLMKFIGCPVLVEANPNVIEAIPNCRLKPTLVSLRGSEEYREWLEGLANRSHLPMAILLEHALREYAERHGYEKPQPRR